MIAYARSFGFLVGYSFRRQLLTRKGVLSVVILLALAIVVFFAGVLTPWTAQTFGEMVALHMAALFYVPMVTLMFGTGAIGDDRDERSLVYIVTRPIPRAGIFLGKLLGVLPQTLLLTVGGFHALYAAAVARSDGSLEGTLALYLPAVWLGSLAYLAFFHFLGAAFRHSTLIAIAYVFFVEVFLGQVPGIMKRISIRFYTSSMVYAGTEPLGLEPAASYLPVAGDSARWVLVGLATAFTIAGAWVFSRREYHEAT